MFATVQTLAPTATVADLVAVYLDHLKLKFQIGQCSEGHKAHVEHYLRQFLLFAGGKTFAQCENDDLVRWLLSRPKWKSNATRQNAINSVTGCFNWLCEERKIPYAPYRRPKILRIRPKPRPAFSEDEFRRFMDSTRNRPGRRRRPAAFVVRSMLYFLWLSGARTCEARTILRSDLRTDGTAELEHHKTDASGEVRKIGLDDRVLRLFRWIERRRRHDDRACWCELSQARPHRVEDHIFLNSNGEPWDRSTFARTFKRFAELAGIGKRKTAYCLRHAFTVRAIEKNISARAIADVLGHASTRMVDWYGKQSRSKADHLRNVIALINS